MKRRTFVNRVLGLSAGAALPSWAGDNPQAAPQPGSGHRLVDLELTDVDRRRPVLARLYLPSQASAAQPVPLVIFSHGLGGSRAGYRYLGSHWADNGIASLHPQHAGSDNSLWSGNPLELVQRLQSAARASEALARVLDLRFVLDQVLASDWAPLIDASRIAAAGHSYGANTAMLVSGAQVTLADARLSELRDERVRAAILISAPPLLGQGPAAQVLGAIGIPTLHVTSRDDTINLPGYRSTVEDRIAIFDAMRGSPRTLAVFNAGGHSIFTDRTTRSGPVVSDRIKSATRELSTLFLDQALTRMAAEVSREGSGSQSAAKHVPLERSEGGESMRRWQLRHQDLLDRFVLPDAALTVPRASGFAATAAHDRSGDGAPIAGVTGPWV